MGSLGEGDAKNGGLNSLTYVSPPNRSRGGGVAHPEPKWNYATEFNFANDKVMDAVLTIDDTKSPMIKIIVRIFGLGLRPTQSTLSIPIRKKNFVQLQTRA